MPTEAPRSTRAERPKTIRLPKELADNPLFKKMRVENIRDGLAHGLVPLSLIRQEDVPVDEEHVRELAASIEEDAKAKGNTGQWSAVLLGEVSGIRQFLTIDGFHRVPAMERVGRKEIYATVRPNLAMEDIVDSRILTAVTHRSVRFSRILEWVDEAWALSPWTHRLPVASAFTLRFLRENTGKKHGLNPEEAEEVKAWVDRKCRQWKVQPNVIHKGLQIAAVADPELVKAARERPSGNKLEAITPNHLRDIVKYLPSNFPLQRVVAEAAVDLTLRIPQTKSLALAVSKVKTVKEAREIVRSGSWRSIDAVYRPHTKARYKKEDMTEPDTYARVLLDKFFDDQITVAQQLIEIAILTGNYNPNDAADRGKLRGLLLSKDLVDTNGQDEISKKVAPWDRDKVEALVPRVMELKSLLMNEVRKRFGLNAEDTEDVFSTIVEKFLTRVSDGRLPSEYPGERHLQRLLLKFVNNTTIDLLRKAGGRGEGRRYFVSLDDEGPEDSDGVSLKDRIGTEDEGFDDIDSKNIDFLKNLLPHLNERERRGVVLKGYFALSYVEIAKVIGTSEETVGQIFKALRVKVAAIAQTTEE